jgi:hypothetical protein
VTPRTGVGNNLAAVELAPLVAFTNNSVEPSLRINLKVRGKGAASHVSDPEFVKQWKGSACGHVPISENASDDAKGTFKLCTDSVRELLQFADSQGAGPLLSHKTLLRARQFILGPVLYTTATVLAATGFSRLRDLGLMGAFMLFGLSDDAVVRQAPEGCGYWACGGTFADGFGARDPMRAVLNSIDGRNEQGRGKLHTALQSETIFAQHSQKSDKQDDKQKSAEDANPRALFSLKIAFGACVGGVLAGWNMLTALRASIDLANACAVRCKMKDLTIGRAEILSALPVQTNTRRAPKDVEEAEATGDLADDASDVDDGGALADEDLGRVRLHIPFPFAVVRLSSGLILGSDSTPLLQVMALMEKERHGRVSANRKGGTAENYWKNGMADVVEVVGVGGYRPVWKIAKLPPHPQLKQREVEGKCALNTAA